MSCKRVWVDEHPIIIELLHAWKKNRKTANTLAEHLGFSPTELSRLVHGFAYPPDFRLPENIEFYKKIASILGISKETVILRLILEMPEYDVGTVDKKLDKCRHCKVMASGIGFMKAMQQLLNKERKALL